MRIVPLGIALLIVTLTTNPAADAQTPKKPVVGPIVETVPSSSYRTLTGKVGAIKPADHTLAIEIAPASGETKAKAKTVSQTWLLALGKQTLLLRAGRNNQFSSIDLADVKTGETVQAVATLQADPADRSHTAWWLVVYPTGTTPPAR